MPTSSRILISGASGLIGAALVPTLETRDFKITRLARTAGASEGQIEWNPAQPLRHDLVSDFDAVIHLAGESVAGFWTKAKKARILNSRIFGTSHLSEAIAKAPQPPRVFICASATGYYGDRGDEMLTKTVLPARDFLRKYAANGKRLRNPPPMLAFAPYKFGRGLCCRPKAGRSKKCCCRFDLDWERK